MKNEKNNKKYILIPRDLQKNLIEFLDEVQMEAAKKNTHEDMHVVNFCSWAIEELLNGFEAHFKTKNKKPQQPKSRDQYLDETFMDWNLPDMSDKDYNKLVDQVDGFLRAWEKEYMKDNPKKKNKKEKPFNPHLDDVVEHCSLEEVEEFLKDDPELTDEERFELYYDERERRKPKEKGLSYKQLLKAANLKPPTNK
jgi:hypothetical protein|tara:strand:+ start:163 stop:750 length:588 start_codon:yes stop_codon:yes gene_type:complete